MLAVLWGRHVSTRRTKQVSVLERSAKLLATVRSRANPVSVANVCTYLEVLESTVVTNRIVLQATSAKTNKATSRHVRPMLAKLPVTVLREKTAATEHVSMSHRPCIVALRLDVLNAIRVQRRMAHNPYVDKTLSLY